MSSTLSATITILLSVLTITSYSQDDKITRLQERVEAAKQRIEATEALIISADSLISVGEGMVSEAEEELKLLAQQKKSIEREHFNARKSLEKQLRSKEKGR